MSIMISTDSKLLNISYKDHVTNEEVRSRIQIAIGVNDDDANTQIIWPLACNNIVTSTGSPIKIAQLT